jgi:general secretion pathway protein G
MRRETINNGQRTTDNGPKGFTLVELLMVIVILALLVGLLLPAIASAIKTARNAAVSAEINQLASALASFKSKYGDYPPSRILLPENGVFPVASATSLGTGDITVGRLAQRSLSALRKLFPRVVFSSSLTPPPQISTTFFYDFNGNGVNDSLGGTGYYILEGHECLVFFLGGIPLVDPATGAIALTGFGKDPTNPFSNANPNAAAMYNPDRQPVFFEFNAGRLFLDPNNLSNTNTVTTGASPGIPGYYDSLGGGPPTGGNGVNFYVYFSGYGSGIYDPNDVNFGNIGNVGATLSEADANSLSPIGLQFLEQGTTIPSPSPAPNPYASTASVTATGTVTFYNAQSFQIISSGIDGLYGVGGLYISTGQGASSATNPLPVDMTNTFSGPAVPPTATTDVTIRLRERDNLTNIKSGTLQ